MSRSVAEIEAEYDGLKALGGRWWTTSRAKELRAERDALTTPATPAAGSATLSPSVVGGEAPPCETTTESSNPLPPVASDTDEWEFIERCIAEMNVPMEAQRASMPKHIYNEIKAKVRVRRIVKSVVAQVGTGAPWPQWSTLGRDDSTGEIEEKKPTRPTLVRGPTPPPAAAAPVPAAAAPAAGTPVTMEAVAALVAAMTAKASDPMEQFKRGVAAEIAKSVKVG